MTSTHDSTTSPQPGRPWQFSIKALMVVTAGTAVALTIVVSLPNVIAVPIMFCMTIVIPALLTVVVVHGPGYRRTFCIGALFPAGLALYVTGWLFGLVLMEGGRMGSLDNPGKWLKFFEGIGSTYRVYAASAWLLAVVVGMLAVGVRRRLEVRSRSDSEGT